MPHPSTSSAYGIWSLNEVRDAVRGDNWPTEVPWSVNLSNVTYDSVSFSVGSQDGIPLGLTFNNDGTKMYMCGNTDFIYEYVLSTGFDLSTASYNSVSLNVSSQTTFPQEVLFNSDGTKMYVLSDSTPDSVLQYTLSTAFDLSTASYDSVSFNVSSQETQSNGLAFNNDGTKMYVVGITNKTIYQYSLSTGFDLSTASYDSVSFSISSQEVEPTALTFNSNGTKMYLIGYGSDAVQQYTLSTAFDMSTASYDSVSFSTASQENGPYGLTFSKDGTKMYIVGAATDTVYQYSTGL